MSHVPEITVSKVKNLESKLSQQLKLLSSWKQHSLDYAWMHGECAKHFLLLNYFMVVPIIFTSTASGAVNLTGINSCSRSNINYIALVLGIVGLVTAGLSATQNLLKYGERSISHKESAKAFEILSRDISVEIMLDNTESKTFANLSEFVKDCNEKFTLIHDRSNQIPSCIYKKLLKRKNSTDHMIFDVGAQRIVP